MKLDVVVCMPYTGVQDVVAPGSAVDTCSKCGSQLWVSPDTLQGIELGECPTTLICLDCAEGRLKVDDYSLIKSLIRGMICYAILTALDFHLTYCYVSESAIREGNPFLSGVVTNYVQFLLFKLAAVFVICVLLLMLFDRCQRFAVVAVWLIVLCMVAVVANNLYLVWQL
jgi:hypothetical protein